jgi:rubrerythrin
MQLPPGCPSDLYGAFNMLKTHSALSLEDMQVLALIEAAGEEFYFRIAAGVTDAKAKQLLTRNGREERGHARRLVKAIQVQGGAPFELPAAADNPFVAALPGEFPATPEFLKMLADAEQDGDRQYEAWASASSHPEVAKLLRANGREESRHGVRDAEVIQILAAG